MEERHTEPLSVPTLQRALASSSVGERIISIHQDCGLDSWLGHMQELTNNA